MDAKFRQPQLEQMRTVLAQESQMDAKFRQPQLEQVRTVLAQEACSASLLKLLQLADVKMSEFDLFDTSKREKAFQGLSSLINRDEHQTSNGTVAELSRDMQNFYDQSIQNLCTQNCKKRKTFNGSPVSVRFPMEFHVKDKWPFLDVQHPITEYTVSSKMVSKSIAYKCVNYRGSIAHGKRAELIFTNNYASRDTSGTVKEVFEKLGGSKILDSIDAIKEELMKHGPVVSVSFRLTEAFLNTNEHAACFSPLLINSSHAVLIVGWKHSAFGEMWLVRSVKEGSGDILLAMQQFSIEDRCVAPLSSFENIPWQYGKRVLNVTFGDDKSWRLWLSSKRMICPVTSKDLVTLSMVLGCGFCQASAKKISFLARDEAKKARSLRVRLNNVSWNKSKKLWDVTLDIIA